MLSTANISIQFGAKPLFENVSVKFADGNRYGLIGANGSGKSTFMKILGGDLEQSTGEVMLGPGVRLGKLKQDQFAFEDERVLDVVHLTNDVLRRFLPVPRIAVCGLNPHAGEHGLFGSEDIEHITPAIETARAEGIDATGPHPADTVFFQAVHRDRYDAIVCMYHDQGHGPMKLLAFDSGVNVTLGLPIVRTSVDHGTAFDIAWRGVAFTDSVRHAVAYARRLVSA